MEAELRAGGIEHGINGQGRGGLEAFVSALSAHTGQPFVIIDYNEHTMGRDESAEAIAYVQISVDQQRVCGVGKSHDILGATLNALLNAYARSKPANQKKVA